MNLGCNCSALIDPEGPILVVWADQVCRKWISMSLCIVPVLQTGPVQFQQMLNIKLLDK